MDSEKVKEKKPKIDKKESPLILIVEDDNILSNMYAEKFKMEGLEVVSASNGEEAFKLFKKGGIDLIISDLLLPKLSGTDLIRKVKEDEDGKNIPIIAWSNLVYMEERKLAMEYGACEYIVKGSLTLDQVIEVIRRCIKESKN